MAKVNFYVVASGGSEGAARVACKVTEKAWRKGMSVYVCAASEDEAKRMDELLWTFREDSFIPHLLASEAGAGDEPVVIGCEAGAANGRQVLVNVGAGLPTELPQVERIAEVVSNDEQARHAARDRYGVYRRLGHHLEHHEVQP